MLFQVGLKLVPFGETLVANVAVEMWPSFQLAKRPAARLFFRLGAKLGMSGHRQNLRKLFNGACSRLVT